MTQLLLCGIAKGSIKSSEYQKKDRAIEKIKEKVKQKYVSKSIHGKNNEDRKT